MTDSLLEVKRVSKSYPTFKSEWIRYARWLGLRLKPSDEFHAIRDVSLSVRRGETVAIIGQNGAGKSTLLKLITGTIHPNEGVVERYGSISAILELGLGFNPDFTGRENVVHSGGLMGYTPDEIESLIPKVESFAELGPHFDAPLRTYSSGMGARLAFSLATAQRPELLIIDEVLSVGDSYFAHKSFARIRQFRDEGSTILLVTHSLADVLELADKAILLIDGRIAREGLPDEVVDYYNAIIAQKEAQSLPIEQKRAENGWSITRSGDYRASVQSMRLVSFDKNGAAEVAISGKPTQIEVKIKAEGDLPKLVLGLMIRDRTGHIVWGSNTWHTDQVVHDVKAGELLTVRVKFDCNIGPGSYSISPALVNSSTHLDENYEWIDNFFVFDVVNADLDFFIGSTYLAAEFEIDRKFEE